MGKLFRGRSRGDFEFENFPAEQLGTRGKPFTPLDLLHTIDYIQMTRGVAIDALREAESRQPGTEPADATELSREELVSRLAHLLERPSTYRDSSLMIRPKRTLIVTDGARGSTFTVLHPRPRKGEFRLETGSVPAFTAPIPGYPDQPIYDVNADRVYAGAVATAVLRKQPMTQAMTIASVMAASEARNPGSPLGYAAAEQLATVSPSPR